MNAVRVLARVVPVVLAPRESAAAGGQEEDDFEQAVFWAQESRVRFEPDGEEEERVRPSSRERSASAGESAEEGQFVLEDGQDSDQEEDRTTPRPNDDSTPSAAPPPPPPLAEQLLAALVDLLFVPGLTLPPRLSGEGSSAAVVYTIWCVLFPRGGHARSPS